MYTYTVYDIPIHILPIYIYRAILYMLYMLLISSKQDVYIFRLYNIAVD